jgi:hypothetical protein
MGTDVQEQPGKCASADAARIRAVSAEVNDPLRESDAKRNEGISRCAYDER